MIQKIDFKFFKVNYFKKLKIINLYKGKLLKKTNNIY